MKSSCALQSDSGSGALLPLVDCCPEIEPGINSFLLIVHIPFLLK
jgi:hypothetical protein